VRGGGGWGGGGGGRGAQERERERESERERERECVCTCMSYTQTHKHTNTHSHSHTNILPPHGSQKYKLQTIFYVCLHRVNSPRPSRSPSLFIIYTHTLTHTHTHILVYTLTGSSSSDTTPSTQRKTILKSLLCSEFHLVNVQGRWTFQSFCCRYLTRVCLISPPWGWGAGNIPAYPGRHTNSALSRHCHVTGIAELGSRQKFLKVSVLLYLLGKVTSVRSARKCVVYWYSIQ
jgi:hypothetical protein